jgi:hypothetical protein
MVQTQDLVIVGSEQVGLIHDFLLQMPDIASEHTIDICDPTHFVFPLLYGRLQVSKLSLRGCKVSRLK